MRPIITALIDIPERLASPLAPFGPLAGRIVVGWVFLWSGWGKLTHLPKFTQNFVDWGLPQPPLLAPFVAGSEFVFGALLLVGLFTRIAGPALVIVMIVAIAVDRWKDVHSTTEFFDLTEAAYMAIFGWLSIVGPGLFSLDYLLQRMAGSKTGAEPTPLATVGGGRL